MGEGGNFQGIYISRIFRAQAKLFLNYTIFTGIRKIWSTVAISEIKICEIENETPAISERYNP